MSDIKQEWIRRYASRALDAWRSRDCALEISEEYLLQLEDDLNVYYDDPLIRDFIESLWESSTQ
ncbi:MAG: hypothetical protein JW828_09495 [Sedimentisphaerales bacterium]|nr:hypothetical protein [Sedimentisphaerales bacterium]